MGAAGVFFRNVFLTRSFKDLTILAALVFPRTGADGAGAAGACAGGEVAGGGGGKGADVGADGSGGAGSMGADVAGGEGAATEACCC